MDVLQLSSSSADTQETARRVISPDGLYTQPLRTSGAQAAEAVDGAQSSHAIVDDVVPSAARHETQSCLPPPKAPVAPVTARTQAAFTSLSSSVDAVLATLKIRAPRIDWTALTPEVPTDLAPDAAAQAAKPLAQAAGASLREIGRQLDSLGSQDLFVAFMMLRQEAHGHGLRVNEQLADMATAVRHAMLTEQQAYDRQALALLDRAAEQQAKLGHTAVWLEGMTALVSSSIAVLMATSGVGLALTVGAIGIGFAAGGLMGGRAHGKEFDVTSAFRGASVGAIVVPAVESFGMLYAAVGRLAGPQMPAWAAGVPGFVSNFIASQSPQALRAAGGQVVSTFEHLFERHVAGIMAGLGPRVRIALLGADPVLRGASQIYQLTINHRITKLNLHGRYAQTMGRICAQAGREAQERWKNTNNFLSGMQESHNEAVEQVLRMLTMHHQTLIKTAGFIR